MPTSLIDSAIFRDIFSTEAMRRVFSDENRVQKYLDFEAALARAQARLGIIPQEAADEICPPLQRGEIDFAQAQEADRAHRLSGAAGGAAARRAMPRRARRVVPLGRDHAGHHRHRDGDANPRGARPGRRRSRRASPTRSPASPANIATRRWPGAAICNRRCRSPSATRWRPCSPRFDRHQQRLEGTAPARAGRRIRRRRRHAVLARRPRARNPSRADEGTRARPAGDRLAHGARRYRRDRLFPRPRHRHLRQDRAST